MNKTLQKLKKIKKLLNLINSGGILELKVKTDTSFSFNKSLKNKLEISYPNQIQYGEIKRKKIIKNDSFVFETIQGWLKFHGLTQNKILPSGYYLFVNKHIKAYHSDSIDLNSISLNDKSTIKAGIYGFAHGMYSKNLDKGIKKFSKIHQASRISIFFLSD